MLMDVNGILWMTASCLFLTVYCSFYHIHHFY